MTITNFKEIYSNSYFTSFLKKVSFFSERSFFFKKRIFFSEKRYNFPEILEGSRVASWLIKTVQRIRSRIQITIPELVPLFLFFIIFLFTPLKSWLKKTYPLPLFYTFFVPVILVLLALILFFKKDKRADLKNFIQAPAPTYIEAVRGFALGKRAQEFADSCWQSFTLVDLSVVFIFFSIIISNFYSFFVYGQVKNLIYESFIWLSFFGIFYIARGTFKEKKYLFWFLWFNFVLVFIFSTIGIIQYLLGVTTPHWIESFEIIKTRIFSTLDNPIILSGYINIFFFLALAVFIKEKKRIKKILLGLFLTTSLLALILTFSRSGWIAFFLGIILFFLIYNAQYLLGLFSAGLVSLIFIPSFLFSRFIGAVSAQYLDVSAVSGRIWTLNNVFHILTNHLLLGVGLGMYGGEVAFKTYPSLVYMEGIQGGAVPIANTDNQFLQVLIQQGIVGFLAFVFLAFVTIFCGLVIYRKLKDEHLQLLVLGITTALFVFFVQGIFADVLLFPQLALPAFTFLGILLVLPSIDNYLSSKKNVLN